jgi:hypothetical protein
MGFYCFMLSRSAFHRIWLKVAISWPIVNAPLFSLKRNDKLFIGTRRAHPLGATSASVLEARAGAARRMKSAESAGPFRAFASSARERRGRESVGVNSRVARLDDVRHRPRSRQERERIRGLARRKSSDSTPPG